MAVRHNEVIRLRSKVRSNGWACRVVPTRKMTSFFKKRAGGGAASVHMTEASEVRQGAWQGRAIELSSLLDKVILVVVRGKCDTRRNCRQ